MLCVERDQQLGRGPHSEHSRVTMADTVAKERLIALLGYCKELTTIHAADAKSTLELKSDDETTVLHETSLKRLQELKRTDGQPVLWLPEGGSASSGGSSGVWMKLARPDDEATRKTPLGQARNPNPSH